MLISINLSMRLYLESDKNTKLTSKYNQSLDATPNSKPYRKYTGESYRYSYLLNCVLRRGICKQILTSWFKTFVFVVYILCASDDYRSTLTMMQIICVSHLFHLPTYSAGPSWSCDRLPKLSNSVISCANYFNSSLFTYKNYIIK